MAIDYKLLGQRVKKFRKKKRLTQAALAEQIEMTPSNISHIERGKTKPSLQTIVDIANCLCVPLDKLMYGNMQDSKAVFAEELEEILADCDLQERRIVLGCAEAVKRGLKEVRQGNDKE